MTSWYSTSMAFQHGASTSSSRSRSEEEEAGFLESPSTDLVPPSVVDSAAVPAAMVATMVALDLHLRAAAVRSTLKPF
eukprot:CAMPEP_0183311414 /NCGR_PEP_ID=MMETSP0160_2-20130417/36808_1 /TAXON_ID=2839 ORGANISM="Odontella Sinensis, Strain Grunow 1884" /NCGR_SAMPLE_ID=MMETSP0160_2 /ASSEMBLY_ACC=CAM_ASM_000250 /LENGTH=77 /DNA_ID=CAMNT_0025475983 /DNA_START=122 /DNA_END=355 /DNA_ORIENTATION=-